MAFTRRGFLRGVAGAGAGVMLVRHLPAAAQEATLDRNKAIVLRYKKAQGTAEEAAIIRETVAPDSVRTRAGFLHLAANAQDQGFPSPGTNLRMRFRIVLMSSKTSSPTAIRSACCFASPAPIAVTSTASLRPAARLMSMKRAFSR